MQKNAAVVNAHRGAQVYMLLLGHLARYVRAESRLAALVQGRISFGLSFDAAYPRGIQGPDIGGKGYDRVVHADDDTAMMQWVTSHERRAMQKHTPTVLTQARKETRKASQCVNPEFAAIFAAMQG